MKLPSIHLYPGDWLRDDVSGCSLAAQGLWLRMMFLMHDTKPYGILSLNGSPIPPEAIARRCGVSLAEYETLLKELDAACVPSRTSNGSIFSRRMVRDEKARKDGEKYGKKGGNPALKKRDKATLKGGVNPPHNPSPEDEDEDDEKILHSEGDVGETTRNRTGVAIKSAMMGDGFPDAWGDWLGYCAEKGHPLTSYTMAASMVECERWGPKLAVQIIRKSIKKQWKNLIDPKEVNPAFSNGHAPAPENPIRKAWERNPEGMTWNEFRAQHAAKK